MNPRELSRLAGLWASGEPVPLSGGDMGQVWRIGNYVVKTHPAAPPGIFEAEKRGLEELAAAGVRTPSVFWAGRQGIVMAYLPPGPANWPALAEMLARLHGSKRPRYGTFGPTFIGRLPLQAGSDGDWRRFWVEKRLLPLLDLTSQQLGALSAPLERFVTTYPWPAEGPVLIHGDLWNGNVLMSSSGPALIDPSAWLGERAVDLAMMRLFGGFPAGFWQAYHEALPVPAEVEEALAAYQLYFLLVHVYFFGSGYLAPIQRVLEGYEAL
ncbi:fructosamine kinase family protein [Oceanithermus sp.]